MSKEIAEKEGFMIGEEVICFGVIGNRKRIRVNTVRDVKYGYDETVQVFLVEEAGYYSLDEVYTKKRLLDMLE